MGSVTLSAVADALLSAPELSRPARRLAVDLLGSAASTSGAITETPDQVGERIGVSWNRARVLLGELAAGGFITYWTYSAAGRRWCHVLFLAWSVGAPRAIPPAEAAETFADPILTQNVAGETDRSPEIASPVVVVRINNNNGCLDNKNNNNTPAPARTCEAGPVAAALTHNVLGDSPSGEADRVVALLVDPDVGMSPANARRCASYPGTFERVLANVLEWGRQRDEGRLRSPFRALEHRLKEDWDASLLQSDRWSGLWQRHAGGDLTQNVSGENPPAEGEGDPELPPVSPETFRVSEEPETPAVDELAVAVWRQVQAELAIEQGGSFDRWVHDTWVIAYEDGEFLIGLPDAFRYDWIVHRLSRQIKRKLDVIMGQPIDVKFRVHPRPLTERPAA